MMVFGSGAFGRWFTLHEDGPLMNGISGLKTENSENSLSLLPCEDTARRPASMRKQKESSNQTLNLLVP